MTRRSGSLADLQQIKVELAAQAERARAEALRAAQRQQAQTQQRNLFRSAVGAVQRLPESGTVRLQPLASAPIPRQRQLDEAAALREALSDSVDVASLLETDDRLSFCRPGVGPDVPRALRRGTWAVQAQVDLHGLRTEEARAALSDFLRSAHQQGLRCVRVIHGKGLGSPGQTPVLKEKVLRWLVQKSEVLALVQAQPAQGGDGALLVLLQAHRKR